MTTLVSMRVKMRGEVRSRESETSSFLPHHPCFFRFLLPCTDSSLPKQLTLALNHSRYVPPTFQLYIYSMEQSSLGFMPLFDQIASKKVMFNIIAGYNEIKFDITRT